MDSRLTSFQRELAMAFGKRAPDFFLTGGAALVGFYLGHRTTLDLDWFTTGDHLEAGEAALRSAAEELGATIEAIQSSPDHRRRVVRRGSESIVVDLVHDHAPQIFAAKRRVDGIQIDPLEEIAANKICAALSRAELRDLVDLLVLERSGVSLERAFADGVRKDAGLTPGQLAFVLSQVAVGEQAALPGGMPAAELKTWLAEFQSRLLRLALPDAKNPNQ